MYAVTYQSFKELHKTISLTMQTLNAQFNAEYTHIMQNILKHFQATRKIIKKCHLQIVEFVNI